LYKPAGRSSEVVIMKKFKGILFCTDLDGTLYRDDRTVSEENLAAIEYFRSEGGLFTFITGRVPQTAGEICRIIKPNAPYGCINGGGIYDAGKQKYLWKRCLPKEAMELVREVYEKLPEMGIQLNTEKNVYFNRNNKAMEHFRAVTGLPDITCHYDAVEEPVLKVVFAHLEEVQITTLMQLLQNHPKAAEYDFIRSERWLFELLPKGVNKGAALVRMAELLGIQADRTIAVGDYDNDVAMLKAAKVGFAVANAVDAVKAAADFITVSNNENAIAAIIDSLDRGRLIL